MPALIALLVSMAFTLVAVSSPHVATALAAPVAIIAILLMAAQARKSRPR